MTIILKFICYESCEMIHKLDTYRNMLENGHIIDWYKKPHIYIFGLVENLLIYFSR